MLKGTLLENFWLAYDAMNNPKLLDKGIELAKEMQQSIVSIGTSLIDRKDVKVANGFRYAIVENDYLKDVKVF